MKTEILEFPQKTLLEETSFWSLIDLRKNVIASTDILLTREILTLILEQKTNLANTVTVLVYATYSSEIVIDDSGNVIMTKAF